MKVYAEDVKRHLSSEDYERYVAYKRICQQIKKERALGIDPPKGYQEIRRGYREMVREVQAKKTQELMELGRREFTHYEERVDSLISKVKRGLSQSKEDPYAYLISRVPKLTELHIFEPWCWCPLEDRDREVQRRLLDEVIRSEFNKRFAGEAYPYLSSRVDEWILPLPQKARYISFHNLPSLQWDFAVHGIGQVTICQVGGEYPKEFQGSPFTLSLKYQLLGWFTLHIPPERFNIHPILTIPLKLLYSLCMGELETKEARIMEQRGPFLTYRVEGLEDPIVLHQKFLTFFRKKGKTSLGRLLHKYGLIDDFTAEIIEGKLVPKEASGPKAAPILQANADVVGALVGMGILKEEAQVACQDIPHSANLNLEEKIKLALSHFKPKGSSPPRGEGVLQEDKPKYRVSEKDRKYLRKLSKTSDYLSYREWGRFLGLGRSGAQYTLRRLENMDLITLEKHPSGDGVRAILTSKGEGEIGAKNKFGVHSTIQFGSKTEPPLDRNWKGTGQKLDTGGIDG